MSHQNLWDRAKAASRRKYIMLQVMIRKEGSPEKNLKAQLTNLEND